MPNLGIVVNKPKDLTSRDVVNKLNKIFGTKKIGHTGTLDPIASGVLVCLVGKYTKLVDIITSSEKEYIATIKLGILTDTLDITGHILKTLDVRPLKKTQIEKVLQSMIGKYEQTIPLYSAVHVNGKRLYEYARNNEFVELPKNVVEIKEIELLLYKDDIIKLRVLVSKGTYIRSIIQSICSKLNTIGVMADLIRTRQGNFRIEDSSTIFDIATNNYKALKIEDMLAVKKVVVDANLAKKIINGSKLNLDYHGYILFKQDNIDLALYYFENNLGIIKILLKEE